MLSQCPWQVSHKIHHDMLPLPLRYLQWLELPYWPLMLSLNLLTHETSLNKIPNVSLHPAPVILAMKIMIHLRATWMHRKTRIIEFPKDLLSQLCQLGNHNPSPIPKTTIRVNGLTLVTHTSLYLVLDRHYLSVLPLGLNHSTK